MTRLLPGWLAGTGRSLVRESRWWRAAHASHRASAPCPRSEIGKRAGLAKPGHPSQDCGFESRRGHSTASVPPDGRPLKHALLRACQGSYCSGSALIRTGVDREQ
jgi:hypothetical protein